MYAFEERSAGGRVGSWRPLGVEPRSASRSLAGRGPFDLPGRPKRNRALAFAVVHARADESIGEGWPGRAKEPHSGHSRLSHLEPEGSTRQIYLGRHQSRFAHYSLLFFGKGCGVDHRSGGQPAQLEDGGDLRRGRLGGPRHLVGFGPRLRGWLLRPPRTFPAPRAADRGARARRADRAPINSVVGQFECDGNFPLSSMCERSQTCRSNFGACAHGCGQSACPKRT